jgi:oligoendopeptidase F
MKNNAPTKTDWNLALLYKGPKDSAIEADIVSFENACNAFQKKYENRAWIRTPSALIETLSDYEKVQAMPEASRPLMYFYFRKELDAADVDAQAKINTISERLTRAGNMILFFEIALGTLPKAKQEFFLKHTACQPFRYFLERVFQTAAYTLSEPEEKILNRLSLPGYSMWVDSQNILESTQSVTYKKRTMPLGEALASLSALPTKDRHALHDKVTEKLKSISFFAERELTAILTDKKIRDDMRGYKKPYSATILHYHNDESAIGQFVDTVTKHFSIAHRFYDLKATMARQDRMRYADRAAKVGSLSKKYSWNDSVSIVTKALDKADPEFSDIFISYIRNGQIDVYPKQGKTAGAYCAGNSGLPTFVLLNHTDTFDSLKTLAHEMGHAIHTELSKSQRPLYEHYTISVAEVASTFFEHIVFEEVFSQMTDDEKIVALHDRLNDFVATIFRQIACFNFELELHETLRSKGALTKETMASFHNKHMKRYLGPKFDLTEQDGYFFVHWSHIRRYFYVYSYAYGALISAALYRRYQQDPSYIHEIKKFLSAGGSATPEAIFQKIGIDTSKASFFEDGLKLLDEDIKKLAHLLQSRTKVSHKNASRSKSSRENTSHTKASRKK